MDTIKLELTAEFDVTSLTDEEYIAFTEGQGLPDHTWDEIKKKFMSNITSAYCWIGEDQEYI